MVNQRESFWSAVYSDFMSHDITREEIRAMIRMGLERTSGNYKRLARLFAMSDGDYKRFMSFLRKHNCQLPFREFRSSGLPMAPAHSGTDEDVMAGADTAR